MRTLGMVTLMKGGAVFAKAVVTCDGSKAKRLADLIREKKPVGASRIHSLAQEAEFGCEQCRAVVARCVAGFTFSYAGETDDPGELQERLKKRFDEPAIFPSLNDEVAHYEEVEADWLTDDEMGAPESSASDCSICGADLYMEAEGGMGGFIGIISVSFCSTCLSGLQDMFEQLNCSDCEHKPEEDSDGP